MTNETSICSLPSEVRAIVWRIFGAGESLPKGKPAYDLIQPIVKKHTSFGNSDWIIKEIQNWFEFQENRAYFKEEKRGDVAEMIVDGVKNEYSECAIWAIAWIGNDIAASMIQLNWIPSEIDEFVECALGLLETLAKKDMIIDPGHFIHLPAEEIENARVPRKSIFSDYGQIDIFHKISCNHIYGQHRPVRNLVALVVELRPDRFKSLVELIDHPMVQALAAHCMVEISAHGSHRTPLQWIYRGACDALIALGILYTLRVVEHLDKDFQASQRSGSEYIRWYTELRWPEDDLKSAATAMISNLAAQLNLLDPLECVRWVGELLSHAPCVFHSQGGQEDISNRIKEIEDVFIDVVAPLVSAGDLLKLVKKFHTALCLPPWNNWTRHLAMVARKVFDMIPEKAEEIGRMVLQIHEQQILENLETDYQYLNRSKLEQSIEGLAISLALSEEQLDLVQWLTTKCHDLPLRVWDAEENPSMFNDSDIIAKHWFRVALKAVEVRKELGHTIVPSEIREIAEILWEHCHFTGQYTDIMIEFSEEVELAAQTVIRFGDPSGTWLLKHANNPKLGPRALWALIAQSQREGGMQKINARAEEVRSEIVQIATDHFKTGAQFTFEALQWWARIWILLDAIGPAQRTAKLLLEFPSELLGRSQKLLVLKLLVLVLSKKRELDSKLVPYPAWLYTELWPSSHTERGERKEREAIGMVLGYQPIFTIS